jgi:hypothetical protein
MRHVRANIPHVQFDMLHVQSHMRQIRANMSQMRSYIPHIKADMPHVQFDADCSFSNSLTLNSGLFHPDFHPAIFLPAQFGGIGRNRHFATNAEDIEYLDTS